MVRTFQLTKALSKLTVLDNVRLGATGQRGERIFASLVPWIWKGQEREITERANELLARFKLDTKADDLAGSLSGGQRKLLEMARALMTSPSVVMLDEPMAGGVNPALTQSLLGHIKSLRDDGMTVVFVEHDMDVIRDISDWVVVMAQGSVIAESTPDELSSNTAVVDAYLGSHHDQALEFDDNGNPVGETAVLAAAWLKPRSKPSRRAGTCRNPTSTTFRPISPRRWNRVPRNRAEGTRSHEREPRTFTHACRVRRDGRGASATVGRCPAPRRQPRRGLHSRRQHPA